MINFVVFGYDIFEDSIILVCYVQKNFYFDVNDVFL